MNAAFPLAFVILLLFASHTHAGGIKVMGTGVSCPATYPASFADIPGATGARSATLFEQTDVCFPIGTSSSSTKRACSSNATVSQIYYSDASCTKFFYQILLGSANTCISSPGGVSFFSCESPPSLPPFVLKDGGVLLGGIPLNHSSGPLATCPANSQSLISQSGGGMLLLPAPGDCQTSSGQRVSFPDSDGTALLTTCVQGGVTISVTLPKAPLCNVLGSPGSASGLVYQIFSPTSTGLSGGAIAGIVIGALAVCSIAGFFAWKHFNKRTESPSTMSGSLNDRRGYVDVDTAYMPPPHQMASPHA